MATDQTLGNYERKREQVRLYRQFEELTAQLRSEAHGQYKGTDLQRQIYDKIEARLTEIQTDLMDVASTIYPSTLTRDELEEAEAEGIFTVEAWEGRA